MEDGRNGKNGAPVQQNVTKALAIGCVVAADQKWKDPDSIVLENLYKPLFVISNLVKVKINSCI